MSGGNPVENEAKGLNEGYAGNTSDNEYIRPSLQACTVDRTSEIVEKNER